MKFTVSVLQRAQADAEQIFNWIADRSSQGAAHWGRAYDAAVLNLSRDAAQWGQAPENDEVDAELWQKFFKTRRGHTYRLLYTIIGNEVRVLRVRGPGQAPVTGEDVSE
jgi:plasmid stabilization system protein ParE